jgi:hypothetical protein
VTMNLGLYTCERMHCTPRKGPVKRNDYFDSPSSNYDEI